MDLDRRRRLLRAALAAVLVPAQAPELQLLHRWLGTWTGIGLIVVGCSAREERATDGYGNGDWRVTFRVTGLAHSITGGSAWESTPWRGCSGRRGRRYSTRAQGPTQDLVRL
jgi:hypothetical protein